MAKKMYYTEDEAAEALGVSLDELSTYVRDDKLRVFQDGTRKMFKVDEVDSVLAQSETLKTGDEITLTPVSEDDEVTLVDADGPAADSKEDTVITAEGISIFDEEDLEIEAADPMAKTQIAPSMEDQIAIDGVGSGSGLLDLTRESDDTSLGAEVLDHIDGMEDAVGTGMAAMQEEPIPDIPPAPEVTYVEAPATEELDAGSGLFNGMAVGLALVMVVLTSVTLSALMGDLPEYLMELRKNVPMVLGGAVVVVLIGSIIGLLIGKGAAQRAR